MEVWTVEIREWVGKMLWVREVCCERRGACVVESGGRVYTIGRDEDAECLLFR